MTNLPLAQEPAIGRKSMTLWALGLVVAIAATVWLRSQESASSIGFILVCGVNSVPSPEFPQVLTTFAVEPVPLYLLIATGTVYLWLFRRIRRTRQRRLFPAWRAVAFVSGIALATLTVFGPLAAYDHTFLSAHMVQHFVLITIAPPLLLVGAPLTLLLLSAGKQAREEWFYPVLHSSPFHAFTNPLVGLVLFALVPTAWYVTPLFEWSLDNDLLHYAGYGIFLFAGIHYWWPIIPSNPTRWHVPFPVQLLYLLALVPIHAFLGMLFYGPDRVIYEDLAAVPREWGPDVLLDQQIAGAIMLLGGEILGLLALITVAVRWAQHEEATGRRLNRELDKRKRLESASTEG